MNSTEHFVVTGGTGFVGRHLAFQMLQRANTRITLLVRGEQLEQARARALDCLNEVARELELPFDDARVGYSLDVILADVTKPLCGLSEQRLKQLAGSERIEFWHVAATLSFEESKLQRIHEQNVTGTRHAIDLAQALGAQRFVHVSTAYVCGSASGEIPEALHGTSRPFNNAYEHSKCLGEQLVSERCASLGLDYRILRPSIVVGLSESYASSGSDSGLYGFVREAQRLRRAFARAGQPVRLRADRDAPLNFIPVDILVDEMLRLHDAGFPFGPVYHLTGEICPTVGDTMDAICDALKMPRFNMVSELDGPLTPLETLLARRIVFYGSYLIGTKTFARACGARITVQARDIERFVERYLEERSGERRKEQSLVARDGFPLSSAGQARGEREVVVLVNAMGMPREALAKLERALATRYDVLTWESRGVPSLAGSLEGNRARFARHADDLEDLLDLHRVSRAHIVGWCTGAEVALEFTRRAADRVRSLVCLNGPFLGLSSARTEYQSHLERIVRYAARSETHATLYHALIAELSAGAPAEPGLPAEARATTLAALSVLDPELAHITGAPLRSPTSFYRYCTLLDHYFDEAPRLAARLHVPALVVSASDDPIAHSNASKDAAALLGAELRMYAFGGHFGVCKNERVIRDVLNFLTKINSARRSSSHSAQQSAA